MFKKIPTMKLVSGTRSMRRSNSAPSLKDSLKSNGDATDTESSNFSRSGSSSNLFCLTGSSRAVSLFSTANTSKTADDREIRRERRRKSRTSGDRKGKTADMAKSKTIPNESSTGGNTMDNMLATGDFLEKLMETAEGRAKLRKLFREKKVLQKL
jgi:hypothetical protein